MILLKNDQVNYFNVFKHLSGIFTREIRLGFYKLEQDNYYKPLEGVSVEEYLSYYLIGFLETPTEDLNSGEINLAYYPGEWKLTVEQLTEDETQWEVLYYDILKSFRREDNEYPNL